MDDKVATLGFAVFSGIGTIRFEKLLAHFGRAEKAWHGEKVVI